MAYQTSQKVIAKKEPIVAELAEKMQKAAAGILVDYRGLTVEEDTKLRSEFRKAGVEYTVVKNTITRFAANQIGLGELDPILNGPTSLAMSFEDPVAPAKIIADFAKDHEALEIKSGFMDGKIMTLAEIETLAKTPSKDTLIAKMMGSLNSPVSSLVRTLQAIVDKGVEPAELAAAAAPAEEAAPAAPAVEEAPAEAPVAEEAAAAPAEEAPAEAPAEEPAADATDAE